jgi:hypothetical protein
MSYNRNIISDEESVIMKKCGNHIYLQSSSNYQSHKPCMGLITKISGTEYIDNRTGECKSFRNVSTPYKDYKMVKRSLNRLFDLLLCNLVCKQNCVCFTMTYSNQMQDFDQIDKDLRNFIKMLRNRFGSFQYILVIEPQTRDSFHIHGVLCFDHKAPYIPLNLSFSDNTLWRHGFATARKVKSDIQVAKYYVDYNLDLKYNTALQMFPDSIDNYKTITVPTDTGVEQRVNGIAIELLPRMLNIVRHSTGIQKPLISYGMKKELLSNLNGCTLRDSKILHHIDEETQTVLNTVKYERYRIR